MSIRGRENRIAKLEENAPEPPSPLDDLTCDELTVLVLEIYAENLSLEDSAPESRGGAQVNFDRHAKSIIETVNLATGKWAMLPGFQNYREMQAWAVSRWESVGPKGVPYVPALNHDIEDDGFGPRDTVKSDLMTRRLRLWAHPLVKQIAESAKRAPLPVRSIFVECQSYKDGSYGSPCLRCQWPCVKGCINVAMRPTNSGLGAPWLKKPITFVPLPLRLSN